MKKIKKESIVKDFINHQAIWDIDLAFSTNALKNHDFTECKIYSYAHYKCVYLLLKAKISSLKEKEDKIAYLDCLIMNYNTLQSNDEVDLLVGVLSGSFLGISFLDITNDILFKAFSMLMLLFFAGIKIFTLTNQKWKFYIMILQQLKSEIE